MSDHNPELDQWRSDGAYSRGYDAAIKDVVAWLRREYDHAANRTSDHMYAFFLKSTANEIERGEAKGAVNE